ncbi:MAG: hypothetical protein II313_02855, partial [Anaerotignum sp.]|nr:hypothetical protein [Anaerotignum sp.]
GIIVAEGKPELAEFVSGMTDKETKYLFETEREVLMQLNADCSEPAAAFAELQEGNIRLRVMYGRHSAEVTGRIEDRLQLAAEVARRLKG